MFAVHQKQQQPQEDLSVSTSVGEQSAKLDHPATKTEGNTSPRLQHRRRNAFVGDDAKDLFARRQLWAQWTGIRSRAVSDDDIEDSDSEGECGRSIPRVRADRPRQDSPHHLGEESFYTSQPADNAMDGEPQVLDNDHVTLLSQMAELLHKAEESRGSSNQTSSGHSAYIWEPTVSTSVECQESNLPPFPATHKRTREGTLDTASPSAASSKCVPAEGKKARLSM